MGNFKEKIKKISYLFYEQDKCVFNSPIAIKKIMLDKFVHQSDRLHHTCDYHIGEFLTIRINEETGNTKFIVTGSKLRPYAWDGCTVKFSICDMVFGTPEGTTTMHKLGQTKYVPKTYYPSMIHDALYQYKKELYGIVSRKVMDKIFYDELVKENFASAKLYYIFVRTFGWIFYVPLFLKKFKLLWLK